MRRFLAAVVAVLASASLASEAAGQCSFTHTAVGGAYEMCAEYGSEFQWTGPNGFSSTMPCITESEPGTYALRTWDPINGLWSDWCTWSFDAPPFVPRLQITGSDSLCSGTTTPWCGPAIAMTWDWHGPQGFVGSDMCVDVTLPGEYMVICQVDFGVPPDTVRRTLTVLSCGGAQPVPMCPLTAWEWARSCGRVPLVPAEAFARVAERVDARSAVWAYGGQSSGLCSLLRREHHRSNEISRAKRHFAAVLANLSAGELGITASDGRQVGLDANLSLDSLAGVNPGTRLQDWVAATESRLLALMAGGGRTRSAREEYRRIARQASAIERMNTGCAVSLGALLADDEDDDEEFRPGLSVSTGGAGATVSTGPRSDPRTGLTHLSWTLERSGPIEVTVMDITGRRIRHLVNGTFAAGTHEFTWDGRDDDGRAVRVGAYFVAGRIGGERLTQRLFLLR